MTQEYIKTNKMGKVILQTKFKELEDVMSSVTIIYQKILHEEIKAPDGIAQTYINTVKEVIRSGGKLASRFGMGWTWWERKRGQRNFTPVNGGSQAMVRVGRNWSYGKFPVHPTTYFNKRDVRTKPNAGEFALIDSGAYLNSFKILRTGGNFEKGMNASVISTNASFNANALEKGFIYEGKRVIRPHLKPAYMLLTQRGIATSKMERLARKLAKQLDKKIQSKGFE